MIPTRYDREDFYYKLEGEDSQKHQEESRLNMASRIDQAMRGGGESKRRREGNQTARNRAKSRTERALS